MPIDKSRQRKNKEVEVLLPYSHIDKATYKFTYYDMLAVLKEKFYEAVDGNFYTAKEYNGENLSFDQWLQTLKNGKI